MQREKWNIAHLAQRCSSAPLYHVCSQDKVRIHHKALAKEKWGSMLNLPPSEQGMKTLAELFAAQRDPAWRLQVDEQRASGKRRPHVIHGRDLYLHDAPLSLHCPALLEEVRPPTLFPVDFIRALTPRTEGSVRSCAEAAPHPSLFVGSAATQSGLHIDARGTRFWMGVLHGRKEFRLLNAADSLALKFRRPTKCLQDAAEAMAASGRPFKPALLCEVCPSFGTKDLFDEAALRPLVAARPPNGAGTSNVSRSAEWAKVRRDGEALTVWQAVMGPGDLIFIPEGWAHQVRNLADETIAISYNFLDEDSLEAHEGLLLGELDMRAANASGHDTNENAAGAFQLAASVGRLGVGHELGLTRHTRQRVPEQEGGGEEQGGQRDGSTSSWEAFFERNAGPLDNADLQRATDAWLLGGGVERMATRLSSGEAAAVARPGEAIVPSEALHASLDSALRLARLPATPSAQALEQQQKPVPAWTPAEPIGMTRPDEAKAAEEEEQQRGEASADAVDMAADQTSFTLPSGALQPLAEHTLTYGAPLNASAAYSVLPTIVSRDEVERIRQLVDASALAFDSEPDTVDAMGTYEFYVHKPGGLGSQQGGGGDEDGGAFSAEEVAQRAEAMQARAIKPDYDPAVHSARAPLRRQLMSLMTPIVEERITPFVRARFPQCRAGHRQGASRECTPCYSLLRRYRLGERTSLGLHHDVHALATVVVSLGDHGAEYEGGLYVATGHGDRHVLPLMRGDAVAHQSDLLHGVRLLKGVRWSWVIWYMDSSTCADHGHAWFAECAHGGNAICQFLHAKKGGQVPGISEEAKAEHSRRWTEAAAHNHLGLAMAQMGRVTLAEDIGVAARWFRRAVAATDDPDAHFVLGQLLLEGLIAPEAGMGLVAEAVAHFESAASGGLAFGMYNLGVVHLCGYGVPRTDAKAALEWFKASGLPEGLHAASVILQSEPQLGKPGEVEQWASAARALGFGTPWRIEKRDEAGTGSLTHIPLHSAWGKHAREGQLQLPEW